MIKSIVLNNFLSHKKTKLDFSDGVNIICGPTDSGKSAIIRALRWVITNRPTGDSFRSSWGGDTEVSIVTDKSEIIRAKTDKGNFYQLDKLEFKAFKADVPEEIKKALNLDATNLQTQFESHFLLSKSAGEVATHFNKVAHLDKIDVGLQNIQRWLRKLQQDIIYNEAQVEELTEQLSEYDDLKVIEKLVTRLELLDKEVEQALEQGVKLVDTSILIGVVNHKIHSIGKIVSKGVLVEKALVIVEDIKVQETLQNRLTKGIRLITEVEESIQELEGIQPFEKMVNRALEIDEEKQEVNLYRFDSLLVELDVNEDSRIRRTATLEDMQEQFNDNMKICPLCETVLK